MASHEDRPSRRSPSIADRSAGYEYKKGFYRSEEVAKDYDAHRFTSPSRKRRNAREWRIVSRALARAREVETILDVPCGTGRFAGEFARTGREVIGVDIALPMMRVAVDKTRVIRAVHGFVCADAERLPFSDGAVDCVASIRFLHHVDPARRVVMLREMARVSRRWLLLDYRHKYSTRYAQLRLRERLGRPARERQTQVSRRELDAELAGACLRAVGIYPVARIFSDKWVVLCEKSVPA
jgi:SAM-dependent methyltransferase